MTEETVPAALERNASCPICHKFYHSIDIHNNPVPSPKNKRKEEELCQCQKGKNAREYRRQYRVTREHREELAEARKKEILSIPERNDAYWKKIRENEEVRRKNGITAKNQ